MGESRVFALILSVILLWKSSQIESSILVRKPLLFLVPLDVKNQSRYVVSGHKLHCMERVGVVDIKTITGRKLIRLSNLWRGAIEPLRHMLKSGNGDIMVSLFLRMKYIW